MKPAICMRCKRMMFNTDQSMADYCYDCEPIVNAEIEAERLSER